MPAPAPPALARPAAHRRRPVVLLLAAVLLAGLLPLALATPASGAFAALVPDDGGADDFPGANQQRDVTGYELDPAPPVGTVRVRLTFDVTGRPGANTADACHLFDTDGDGDANIAICASLGGDPFTTVVVNGFTCADSQADRCGQPDSPLPLAGTTCTTSTVAQVFAAGDDQPDDAEVVCSIALSDLGGGSPALLNSCAFPSAQPNSAPSDCVRAPRDARLVIVKQTTVVTGDQFPFTLSSTADPASTVFTATGAQTSAAIPIVSGRSYTLAETVPAGWQLQTASCSNSAGPVGTLAGSTITGVTAAQGQTVTCTFVNQPTPPAGTATVTKVPSASTLPEPGGTVTFTVTITNGFGGTLAVTGLTDTDFGDLRNAGNGAVTANTCPSLTTVAGGGGTVMCSFSAPVTGNAGFVHQNTVTATLDTAGSFPASATVTITDVAPTVTVTKSPVPSAVTGSAPVVFTVQVTNTSAEQVTLTTLTDDVYGNLAGQGTCAVGQTITSGGSYTCSFTQTLAGSPGTSHVNTVTATVQDDDQTDGTGSGSATVSFLTPPPPPTAPTADLSVAKAVNPVEVAVGETAVWTLLVSNAGPGSASSVTVTDQMPDGLVIDDVDPSQGTCTVAGQDVTCALGTIAAGDTASVAISVQPEEAGSFENLATVDSPTPDPDPSDDSDEETLDVIELPPAQICEPFLEGEERVEGPTRIETAIAGSQVIFCDLEATAVVLTRSDLFPDAQAGTPLAIAEDAPLLLSEPEALNPLTEEEILRVLQPGGTVYLLGGEVALSQAVEDRIVELGFQAVRYGGENRFGTAAIIAAQGLGDPMTVLVADGGDFPDSILAGSASLQAGGGIGEAAVLLTSGQDIPPETQGYLDARVNPPTIYAIGAPARAAFPDVPGYGSDDRYETSVAVAERFFTAPRIVGIATGLDFADALTGGAVVGRPDAGPGPMLLVDGDVLPPVVAQYLQENEDSIVAAVVFGGTAAISTDVEEEVISFLSWTP